MTVPITAECFRNRDEQDYLAECEHQEHELQHCFISGCSGFIVNWQTWDASPNYICEMCHDSGYGWGPDGVLVQPQETLRSLVRGKTYKGGRK